jgi:acyl-CoA synthetase (NDP forming)
MKKFFEPETVALIGATENHMRPGYQLFTNLNYCFGENLYPVNPRIDTLEGRNCYASILDIPVEVDVAVIFINASAVPEALEQCAEKGIRRVIIESAGFAEAGPHGVARNERCLKIARKAGIRLWGPNCMGAINVRQMKVLSFLLHWMWRDRFFYGPVSLVVQSGMLSAGFLARILSSTPFGLSKIASIGNKVDVDESDVLEYLIGDPETGVIGMYLESIKNGRRFYDLCQSTNKPIVVLKAGRTAMGAQAAKSHTASLAQDDSIIGAALRQAGVIRVYDMHELIEVVRCLGMFYVEPKPKARLAVLTFSGGAGVVSSDSIGDHGMDLAQFSETTMQQFRSVFPEWMEPANPLDLFPAIDRNGYFTVAPQSIEAALSDPAVDGVFAHIFAYPTEAPLFDYEKVAGMIRDLKKPMVVWTLGDDTSIRKLKQVLENMSIPVVDEINRGVRILAAQIMRR